jgi:hypothetical protein
MNPSTGDVLRSLREERDRVMQNIARLQERLKRLDDADPAQKARQPIAAIHGDNTMTEPRLCKDCRFSELHTTPKEQWVCAHPSSRYQFKQSPVTGRIPEPRQLSCWEARWDLDNRCGEGGRHWEKR